MERRLEAALHARAELVQPEDLRHPVLPAARPDHPRWQRATTYVAAAAACAAAVAGTYALSHDDRRAPEPAPAPGPPEGWQGGIGRSGPAADLQALGTGTADLDGDGALDTIWLRSSGEGPGPVRVEALLSSTPDDVRWTLLDEQARYASHEGPAQLDDDLGEELVLSTENDSGFQYLVVDLVDGRLQEVPAPDGALRSVSRRDGRTGTPRVVDGRLLSWRSRGPIEGARYVRADATWWAIVEMAGMRRLVPAETGDLCLDMDYAIAGPCLAGDRPDAEPPDLSGDNPFDEVPDLLPVAGRVAPGRTLAFEVAGAGATARLTGPADGSVLAVELGGETLTADLGAGEPARLVDGVLEGENGPALLVDRGATWSAYAVRDGALTELYVSDEAFLGNVTGNRTELSDSGLLWTAVDAIADPDVQDVYLWDLDRGPGLMPYEIACLRFPADGSDPTFANC